MSKRRVFFQDFLFEEMPVDNQDNPLVKMKTIGKKDDTGCTIISFEKMLRMNKEEEWVKLFNSIAGKQVLIKDDLALQNEEMKEYKDFYMKTYYYNLSKHCLGCYVSD